MNRSAYGSMVASGVFGGKGLLVDVGFGSKTADTGIVIVLWTCIRAVEEAVCFGEIVDKDDIGLGELDLSTVEAGTGAVLSS